MSNANAKMHSYSWKDFTNGIKRSFRLAIAKHPQLFPFSKQRDKIEEIVGEELLYKELISTASDIANGKYVEVKMDHLNLKFEAFV